MNDLGTFIKKVRIEKNLSQEIVAKQARLARSYISRIEDGHFKAPSAMILIRLAKALGVSHDALFHAAGYVPKVNKDKMPSFDAYLRTKFPTLSEKGIEEMEILKNIIQAKEKKEKDETGME